MGKKVYFFLAVILAFGFLLRLYKIDSPIADWHSWRQADTASVTRSFVQDGINLFSPRYHDLSSVASGLENPRGFRFVEFPLYNAIHAIFAKSFSAFSLEKWGRLLSAFFSLGSAFFVFLLGRRFISPIAGLLAAFFFLVLPFNVYFSRVILPEPLAVFLASAALWFFVLWIDKEKFWLIFSSGLLFALSILVKPYTVFYGLPMLYLAYAKFGWKKIFFQPYLWIFLSLSLFPFFLWRAWMWNEDFLRGIPHWEWAFDGDQIRFRPAFWWWIFEERLGRLILGVWLAAPFFAGVVGKTKERYPWFIQFFLLGQFFYVAIIATANVRHDYYQTLVIPAVSLAVSAGTIALWNLSILDKKFARFALVVLVLFGLFASFYSIRGFYSINHPEIIQAGKAADRILPPDAKVIAPYNGDTAFLYQTKRSGWPYVTLPIDQMVKRLGAEYYVSVNFDEKTKEIMQKYKVLEKTDSYVIVELK